MFGESNRGSSGVASSTTAMMPARPNPRCSTATWKTRVGTRFGLATTYCPKPALDSWLADRISTVATDTSPITSGAMRWVSKRVPTTPTRRAPTLLMIVRTAPRTALRARDNRVRSGHEEGVARQDDEVHLGRFARGDHAVDDRDLADVALGVASHQHDVVAIGEAGEAAGQRDRLGHRHVHLRRVDAGLADLAGHREAVAVDPGDRDGDLRALELDVFGESLLDLLAQLARRLAGGGHVTDQRHRDGPVRPDGGRGGELLVLPDRDHEVVGDADDELGAARVGLFRVVVVRERGAAG